MPFSVGNFDPFWENYDSRGGPALVSESKVKAKAGDARPNWRLQLGAVQPIDLTKKLISAEVTYSLEDGSSGMRFTVADSLYARRRERGAILFWIGYGTKLVPYFYGQLAEPTDSRSGIYSEATAYGIGARMGQLYIGGRLSYKGQSLENAWRDLIGRFGAEENQVSVDIDRFDFPSGVTDTVEADGAEQGWGLENSFAEVEETILTPTGLRAYDQIGGLRLVRRPVLVDKVVEAPLVATFNESDYPADPGFTVSASQRNIYDKVIVFRRNEEYAGGGAPGNGAGMVQAEDGTWVPESFYGSTAQTSANAPGDPDKPPETEYAVYAEWNVSNTSIEISARRIYFEPDFLGSQFDAEARAEDLADSFSAGAGRFEWSCFPVDLALNEAFGVVRVEEVRDGPPGIGFVSLGDRYAVTYACVAEEITFTLEAPQGALDPGHWGMSISGPCVERSRVLVRAGSSSSLDLAVSPGGYP